MTLANTFIPGQKPPPGLRMSYEEFLQADFDHHHYEWVDGEAVEMAQIERIHNDIVIFVVTLLRMWVELKRYGWIFAEPFHMKTGPDLPGRSPDVMFVATENEDRIERLTIRGPANLVVEVVSPGSRRIDRTDKFAEYEQGGVKEYWIIDPIRRRVDWYMLVDGRFRDIDVDEDGKLNSKVLPGIWFRDEWFFNRPAVLDVLKAWGVV